MKNWALYRCAFDDVIYSTGVNDRSVWSRTKNIRSDWNAHQTHTYTLSYTLRYMYTVTAYRKLCLVCVHVHETRLCVQLKQPTSTYDCAMEFFVRFVSFLFLEVFHERINTNTCKAYSRFQMIWAHLLKCIKIYFVLVFDFCIRCVKYWNALLNI